ncbi:hypothetical protein FNU79_17545 [Deinococcus detaillensis]|uniref:Porin n=2 Tax=Deinococcus detaillensis TaxID=2592048 RepID=A0A553UHZ6_9DEIO|nr:hypothetical protein FNU79_17545 [Deinococcus detaillensis]
MDKQRRTWRAAIYCSAIMSSVAGASGEVQIRYYSVSAAQSFLDAFSVQLKLQSPSSQTNSYAVDLSVETPLQSLTGRYTSGRHTVQVQARRQVDFVQKSANLSGNLNYSYSPVLEASGLALSSFSAFYAYNGSQSPTQATTVHTGGLNFGVRISDALSGSLSGSGTLFDIKAGTFSSNQTSLMASGSLNYRKSSTTASINPSFTFADGKTRWNVGLNARAALTGDLALSGYTNLSSSSPATTTADLDYDASKLLGQGTPKGKLSVGAAVTLTSPVFTVTGRVRTAPIPNLTLGGSVGYTPSTSALTYSADASGKLGPMYLSANTSLSTAPETAAAFSVSTSISAQAQPVYGSVSLGYRRQGESQSGYASGTFGYRQGSLDLGTTLALNAFSQGNLNTGTSSAAGAWQILGTADFTAAYAVLKNIDVTGSVRYEQASTASSNHLRYGAGLRYRF